MRTNRKTYGLLTAILLLLVFFHYLGWLTFFENFARKILNPILTETHKTSVKAGDNVRYFKNRDEFITAYENCLNEKEDNNVLNTKLKLLEDENTELKTQIKYLQKNPTEHVTLDVVGRDLNSAEQIIILNGGSNHQLAVGQPVVIREGILVGKVFKVEPNLAWVRVVNDHGSKIAATILNNDHSLGIVEGGYGISLRMKFIPRNEVINVSEDVVTSGLDGLPRGLLIGKIAVVENEAYQPFQQAILTPSHDLTKLTVVTVLVK
ncbi:MAG TPA: rod shape-determining protein MreC [Patescibacteria group bacterium]|nr:rod shape-determining protein MreC [Patescibacteria group bacterium]